MKIHYPYYVKRNNFDYQCHGTILIQDPRQYKTPIYVQFFIEKKVNKTKLTQNIDEWMEEKTNHAINMLVCSCVPASQTIETHDLSMYNASSA